MEAKLYETISGQLIGQVEKWFYEALGVLRGGKVSIQRENKNGYAHLALPSYIIAVASVEAFVNESFLSPVARLNFEGASLYQLNTDWLEKVDIREKIIIVARLLLGETVRRGQQPFQDFSNLVLIRNEIVHYKMSDKGPKCVGDLNQKHIGLDTKPPEGFDEGTYCAQPWASEISSTEGIRWAHNTATSMKRHLIELMPQDIDEFNKRGLDGEMKYGRFRSVQLNLTHSLSFMRLIDETARDRAWDELGLGKDKP